MAISTFYIHRRPHHAPSFFPSPTLSFSPPSPFFHHPIQPISQLPALLGRLVSHNPNDHGSIGLPLFATRAAASPSSSPSLPAGPQKCPGLFAESKAAVRPESRSCTFVSLNGRRPRPDSLTPLLFSSRFFLSLSRCSTSRSESCPTPPPPSALSTSPAYWMLLPFGPSECCLRVVATLEGKRS